MSSFAEFIAEEYHSEARLIWNLSGPNRATAKFTVEEIKVVVSFEQPEPGAPWQVIFEVEQGTATKAAFAAFAIFNGVFQAVREFVEVRQPDLLVFVTKQDRLANIYKTYLRRESARLRELGYEIEPPQSVDPFLEFALRRTRPSQWKA